MTRQRRRRFRLLIESDPREDRRTFAALKRLLKFLLRGYGFTVREIAEEREGGA